MTVRGIIRKRIAHLNVLIKAANEKKDAKYLSEFLLRRNECEVILNKIGKK